MPVQAADYFLAIEKGGVEFVLVAAVFQYKQLRVFLWCGGGERVHFQRAEDATEFDLLFRGNILIAKYQYGVLVPQGLELPLHCLTNRFIDIKTEHFRPHVLQFFYL